MCHQKYCNPHQIATGIKQESQCQAQAVRSSEEGFFFKTVCFFCGRAVKFRRKWKYDVLQAKTIELKDNILKICNE